VLKNGALKMYLGSKREEVTGDWRKLCKDELQGLYSPRDQVKNDEMGRECGIYGRW
jgi:hypothetical protein